MDKLYDIGTTSPSCLYDFASFLGLAENIGIDHNSELGQAYHKLVNSAYAQLPKTVTIDFSEE